MAEKLELVQRVEYLKQLCKGKKVLHLGCTNYPYTEQSLEHNSLLHLELKEISSELWGFDFDQRGLDILVSQGIKNLHLADLEKLENVNLDQTFDVIIAGEMIEHLSNPGLFLNGIKRFMNQNTNLVITTINAYSGMRYAIYALRGKRGLNEPVHQDHVAYYSYSTLKLIVQRAELEVGKFSFYDLGPEHRPHSKWYWNLANDLSVKFSPQMSDGIIAECRLSN
jgi:2-polyprenyl-3-methyl-5-hydroxy-6-metoxy-1,4-benzoquinol methylase